MDNCNNRFCRIIGSIEHSPGAYSTGFHEGLKAMNDYVFLNKVARPKVEWVKNDILKQCSKRTESARPLIVPCDSKNQCTLCSEKFDVINKLLGVARRKVVQ